MLISFLTLIIRMYVSAPVRISVFYDTTMTVSKVKFFIWLAYIILSVEGKISHITRKIDMRIKLNGYKY